MGIFAGAIREFRDHPSSITQTILDTFAGRTRSATGVYVSADAAMGIAAVYSCVKIHTGILSTLPLITYRRLQPQGKERAPEYFLYPLLHDAPNEEQNSTEFIELMHGHLLLRGNAYAAIERNPGSGRPIRMVPLHPDRIQINRNRVTGELIYEYRPPGTAQPVRYFSRRDGEMLHLRTMSSDGVVGKGIVEFARESLGLAMATEQYSAKLYGNGAHMGGTLTHPKNLSPKAFENLQKSMRERSGLDRAWEPLILEEGMSWTNIGMTARDAELATMFRDQRSVIASWFLVPPHMIGDTAKSTSWGTGIEQQQLGFYSTSLRYWCVLWERAMNNTLIPISDRSRYFSEFLIDGLLRGDLASRTNALHIQRMDGIINADEWREIENKNPLPDGLGQEYWKPLNTGVAGEEPEELIPEPIPEPEPPDEEAEPE